MTSLEKTIREILNTAVWAPSGGNSQPWSFVVHKDILRIFLDPTKDNPILNVNLSGSYIAHGALIENIELVAPTLGYIATVRLLPDPTNPLCTAEITFSPGGAVVSPLASRIRERHTNRKPYAKKYVPQDAQSALVTAAAGTKRVTIHRTDDPASIKTIAHVSAYMEQIALETPALRDLFVKEIFWSQEENERGGEGLYIRSMELPLPARAALRNMVRPFFARVALALGFAHAARIADARVYAASPLMLLVSVTEEKAEAYLEAGRVLERLWLSATDHGLSAHPVTGILYLARRVDTDSLPELLPRQRELVRHASQQIQHQFGLDHTETPVILMRVGYAPTASARSGRKPPLITNEPT